MSKVLVVDDDEAVRVSVCEILAAEGYETEAAMDGEQALALLGPDIDAMLLDLHLPKLDGIHVLNALDDGPVVIVLSAFEYRARSEVENRYSDRVCAFLQKPVPPPMLLQTLRRCMSA